MAKTRELTELIQGRINALIAADAIDHTSTSTQVIENFDVPTIKKQKGGRDITPSKVAYHWGLIKKERGWINSRSYKVKKGKAASKAASKAAKLSGKAAKPKATQGGDIVKRTIALKDLIDSHFDGSTAELEESLELIKRLEALN